MQIDELPSYTVVVTASTMLSFSTALSGGGSNFAWNCQRRRERKSAVT